MIRIFIADDHVMFAEGVESLLIGEPDFMLYGKASTAAETQRTMSFLASYPADNAAKWTAQVRVLMASNEFLHVD